jgi:hypothetical protein
MLQDEEGIVPRALKQLLQHGAVAISLLQIYSENVQDLLAPAEPCKHCMLLRLLLLQPHRQ